MPITATLLAYHLICPRKAWLHHHGIRLEHESEAVQLGKLLDSQSYRRKPKGLTLQAELPSGIRLSGKLDWVNLRDGVLHEVKKGRACEDAHRWQVRFYLWLLRLCEVQAPSGQDWEGQLNYPQLRQTEAVELLPEHEAQLGQEVAALSQTLAQEEPPEGITRRSFCRKCAFEEWCYG